MRPELPEGWVKIKWPKNHKCVVCKLGPKDGGGFLYSSHLLVGQAAYMDPVMQAWYERDKGWHWSDAEPDFEMRDHWSRVDCFQCLHCGTHFAHDWGDGGLDKNPGGVIDMQYWKLELDIRQQTLFPCPHTGKSLDKPFFAPMEVAA